MSPSSSCGGESAKLITTPERMRACRPSDRAWQALSETLLGDATEAFLPRAGTEEPPILVIVPGAQKLAHVPWCALRVGGDLLVHRAAIQLAPALSVLTGPREPAPGPRDAIIYTVPQAPGESVTLDVRAELAAWQSQSRWGTTTASSGDEFGRLLHDRGRWAVGYVAAHGTGGGLDHQIRHADGSTLSVTDALRLWWPEITVLSSCHVGTLTAVPGTDPLGLPLALLMRGASYVIGCNQGIPNKGAATIGSDIIGRLSRSPAPTPPHALREAQLAFLGNADWRGRVLAYWAPFQVVSMR